jgi:hypothetical protein
MRFISSAINNSPALMDEAAKLMEVGFEYHAEVEGHKLFRKRK